MGKTLTTTEAVRKFSEILNTIKYRDNHYTILRGGKPVASICPVETDIKERRLGELKKLLEKIPRLGDEAERFEEDLKRDYERIEGGKSGKVLIRLPKPC